MLFTSSVSGHKDIPDWFSLQPQRSTNLGFLRRCLTLFFAYLVLHANFGFENIISYAHE